MNVATSPLSAKKKAFAPLLIVRFAIIFHKYEAQPYKALFFTRILRPSPRSLFNSFRLNGSASLAEFRTKL
jgi:hypothetical protein